MSGLTKDARETAADRDASDKPRVRLVPLAPGTSPAPNLKTPLMAPNMRPLTPPGNASRLTPLVPGVPGLPGMGGAGGLPGVRPAFVRPVGHPLLRGLAKPRPSAPPLLGGAGLGGLGAGALGASLPSLRSPGLGRPPLVPGGLPKGGPNASAASLLAGMAGMDETANAELDGIREALLQAEATEQYLAARQEEIANALLAVAGASAAMPSLESLLMSQDQDAITKALTGAAGGAAPALPTLPGLGGPGGPELDEQTKALLAALGGVPPALPAPPAAPAAGLEALLAAAGLGGGGAGGVEALLAAASGAGGAAAAEALLAAAAGGGGTPEALLQAAAAGTGPAPSAAPAAPAPAAAGGGDGDELDDMTKALLAAAGVDANAQGSDDVTQALLAAAVSNSAAVTAAADGKEDEITKALLAAARDKGGEEKSSAKERESEAEKPEKPDPESDADKQSATDLSAATANVPEEMTKALLAAVATNTPSAAGDADRIIKAVLRAATASMSEETAAEAEKSKKKKKQDKDPKAPEPPQTAEKAPQPQAKAAAMPAFEIAKKDPEKPAQRPQGSMVSTEFLRAMEENAKASARTSAAKVQGARPPAISFSIGSGAKKPKADPSAEQDEQERINEQLLAQHEATKAWVFFGKIPKGTSEGLIRTECAKYGTVTSILYNAEPDSLFEEPWALVSLASLESAAKAVDRLNSRLSLFGGSQQVEVRMGTPEDIEKWEDLVKAEEQVRVQPPPPVMAPTVMVPVQTQMIGAPETQLAIAGAGADPAAAQPRQRRGRRARDQSGDSRGSGGRKRRRGGGYESRSDSRSASAYRDPPPLPVVQRKVYGLGGFDNASVDADKKTPRATAAEASLVMAPSGDRRIGTRGSWAEFVTREWEYYYVNIHTGEKRWMLPVAEMRGVAPRRSN